VTDDGLWLWKLVRWAFVLRAAVALILHWSGFSARLAPDEGTYFDIGRALAAYWEGAVFAPPGRVSQDDPFAYFYLNAISYYLFDSILPLKLLNAAVGALVCRYAFFLANAIAGARVARRTAVMAAILPSLVLWSSVNIRDIWILFLLVYLSWKGYQLVAGTSFVALLEVAALIAVITAFRPYLFVVISLPLLAGFLIGRRGQLGRNFVLAALAAAAVVFISQQGAAAKALDLSFENLAERRRNLAVGAGSGYQSNVDISTPGKALAFLPVGLLYFWFSPFPWQMKSFLQFLSLPEMLFIYALTPSVMRGVAALVRNNLRDSLQVLLLTGLLTLAYAIGSGNIGTLYRHRAQSMVFYLMFAAVGLEQRRRPTPGAAFSVVPAPAGR
jgi:hypothetical protein